MYLTTVFVYFFVSLSLLVLILLRPGKGGLLGASGSSGGSAGSLFGTGGPASFMTKVIATLGGLFFLLALYLGRLAHHRAQEPKLFRDAFDTVAEEHPLAASPTEVVDSEAIELDGAQAVEVEQALPREAQAPERPDPVQLGEPPAMAADGGLEAFDVDFLGDEENFPVDKAVNLDDSEGLGLPFGAEDVS